MTTSSPMQVVHGNKDVIELLTEELERAKRGELVAVAVCGVSPGDGLTTGTTYQGYAVNADTPFPWPRLLAAVTVAHHRLSSGMYV